MPEPGPGAGEVEVMGHSRSKEQHGQRLRGQGCGLWENPQCLLLVGTSGLRWRVMRLGWSSPIAARSPSVSGVWVEGCQLFLLAILCLSHDLP